MRLAIRAVLPIVFLLAAVVGVVFLLRDEGTPPETIETAPAPVERPAVVTAPVERPAVVTAPVVPEAGKPGPEAPERAPVEEPARAASTVAGRIAALLSSLGPRSVFHAFIPDLRSSVSAFKKAPAFTLLKLHLRPGLFRDEASRAEVVRLRSALAELEETLEGAEST
jgi:hypothetical protein